MIIILVMINYDYDYDYDYDYYYYYYYYYYHHHSYFFSIGELVVRRVRAYRQGAKTKQGETSSEKKRGKEIRKYAVKETTNLCSNVAANDYLFYRSLMDPRGNQRGRKQQLKRL